MYQIELDKAKAQIDALIQTALEGEEVVITRNDEPILRLVPVAKTNARRKAGTGADQDRNQ